MIKKCLVRSLGFYQSDSPFLLHQQFCLSSTLFLSEITSYRLSVWESKWENVSYLTESSTQVCRWLRLFWVTHCSLCWTVGEREKNIFKSSFDTVSIYLSIYFFLGGAEFFSLTWHIILFTFMLKLGEPNNDHKKFRGMMVQQS